MLQKRFKEHFGNQISILLWRQWRSFGIAANVVPSGRWVLDPEALLFATYFPDLSDKRLLDVVPFWIADNVQFINATRLKRIFRYFARLRDGFGLPVNYDDPGYITSIKSAGETGRSKKIQTPPNLSDPALLRLRLRAIFGRHSYAECLLYLIYHPGGTSLSISREVFLDQKTVYNILQNWVNSRLVEKKFGRNSGYLFPERMRKLWLRMLEIKSLPMYINWGKLWPLLLTIHKALESKPWKDDTYLLSSFYRDIFEELRLVSSSLDVTPPVPESYTGTAFIPEFEAYLSKLMDILLGN